VSPTAIVIVDGLNASLASAPMVRGMFLARVRRERREGELWGWLNAFCG